MLRIALVSLAALGTLTAVPASADHKKHKSAHNTQTTIIVEGQRSRLPAAPNNDSNSWWLDYKTDISEAKRELISDLRRANDEEDRIDAYAEYEREIADAKYDYRKEMAERGYRVRNFKEDRNWFAKR